MCGACGRTTVADPILGSVRTLRQHLIVAQTVNVLCRKLPGAAKVTAVADGWTATSATGGGRHCRTVGELWRNVIGGPVSSAALLAVLPPTDTNEAGAEESALAAAVIRSAREQAQKETRLASEPSALRDCG